MDETGTGRPHVQRVATGPATGFRSNDPVPDGVVTVRYYAAAREATGVDSEQIAGARVSAVLDTAVSRHPSLAPVLAVASVLADGRLCDRAEPVVDGLTLEVLPPFAGG